MSDEWDPEYNRAKGQAFREARSTAGEDLRHAASRLGISVPYLSRLERGLERWPEGENSLSANPCPNAERGPHNLMDFPDINRVLWLMIGQDQTIAWPWWCKDCRWPLMPSGLHFEIELGEPEESQDEL